MFFVRLSRIIPLLIVLAIMAAVIYLVALFRSNPLHARWVVIRFFVWAMGIFSVFFALASAYALFEHNVYVLEMVGTFLATTLVGLVIALVCRWRFLKRNPKYRDKALRTRLL